MSPVVVAFGAHPDDAELAFGATLARLAAAGARVVVVDLTAGERGSRGDAGRRAAEAAAAARELGVAGRECLGLADLGVRADDPAQVRAVTEALRRLRPALVLAPHPEEGHPDHRHGAALVERACLEARLARADAAGEPHVVEQLLFAWPGAGAEQGGGAGGGGSLGGGLVVDVTATFAVKRAALERYASQFVPGPGPETRLARAGFLELVEARARVAGAAIEATYGEGFTWRGALRLGGALAAWLGAAGGGGAMKRAAARQRPPGAGRRAKKAGRPARGAARGPLKIGIACYPTFGGSGIVATEIGSRLADRGYEVHFISLALPYHRSRFSQNVFFHEVVIEPYPLFQSYSPLSLALAAKMSDVAEHHGLDLLHVHYAMPFAASAFLARELVKPRRLPVVTTLHGTDITVVGQQPTFHRLTKFSIESSDAVTAVSRFLRERTIESLGIRRPIEVIHNFVDTRRFAPRAHRGSVLAPADVPVLMHASNFRTVKNLDTLVRVFARVREQRRCRLVFIGDGPEKARTEDLCRELGLTRDALFLGNQDIMEELLPLADVFLLPSRQESFGLVALEAMSAGVPVVASDVGGLPEVVADGKTGFLRDPDDAAGMAEAVLRLLGDDALRARFGRAGRRLAMARFGAEEGVARYERVYRGVLG